MPEHFLNGIWKLIDFREKSVSAEWSMGHSEYKYFLILFKYMSHAHAFNQLRKEMWRNWLY